MAVYVTKKCPHCGRTYQFHQPGNQRKYGCPYRKCISCGEHYYDNDIKEPALYGFKNLHETIERIKTVLVCFFTGTLGLAFSVLGIFTLIIESQFSGILYLVFGITFIFLVIRLILTNIQNHKDKEKILVAQRREYDESYARIKDTNYLTLLAQHDYRARKLLHERTTASEEHYANRP